MFYSFDKLILMADGCMVYTGAPNKCLAYLAKIGYLPPADYNPADFLMDLVTSTEVGECRVDARSGDRTEGEGAYAAVCSTDVGNTTETKSIRTILIDAWDNSPVDEEIGAICAVFEAKGDKNEHDNDDILSGKYLTSYQTQFVTLLERSLLNSKSVLVTNLTIFQTLAVALLCGAMWWQMPNKESRVADRAAFIFFFMTYWFFSTLFHVSFFLVAIDSLFLIFLN